jgi:hypothetical protein
MSAEVAALRDLDRAAEATCCVAQREEERPAADGATRIVPTVRADQELRARAGCSVSGTRAADEGADALRQLAGGHVARDLEVTGVIQQQLDRAVICAGMTLEQAQRELVPGGGRLARKASHRRW